MTKKHRSKDSSEDSSGLLPGFSESHALSRFIAEGEAGRALSLIVQPELWPSPVLLMSGPEATGKTHLCRIFEELHGAQELAAGSLDEKAQRVALGHMTSSGWAWVLDRASDANPESLFHLTNRFFNQTQPGDIATGKHAVYSPLPNSPASSNRPLRLLLADRHDPEAWPNASRDLISRLRAASFVRLSLPSDQLIGRVLEKLLADQGIRLPFSTIQYALERMERSQRGAYALAKEIDRKTVRGRRVGIGIGIVREALQAYLPPETDSKH